MIPYAKRTVDRFGAAARAAPDDPNRPRIERSLTVGAKTLAGVGLGVLGILVGAAAAGLAFEVVIVPTLLVKLAGGIAGGSLGLAKGLEDERRRALPPLE